MLFLHISIKVETIKKKAAMWGKKKNFYSLKKKLSISLSLFNTISSSNDFFFIVYN